MFIPVVEEKKMEKPWLKDVKIFGPYAVTGLVGWSQSGDSCGIWDWQFLTNPDPAAGVTVSGVFRPTQIRLAEVPDDLQVAVGEGRDMTIEVIIAHAKGRISVCPVKSQKGREWLGLETPAEWRVCVPQIGEVFELTLDGDDEKNAPERLARYAKVGHLMYYDGSRISGVHTRQFTLVRANGGFLDGCRDLKQVRETLTQHGRVPECQWIWAFHRKFSLPDETYLGISPNARIGFANDGWILSVSSNRWATGFRAMPFIGAPYFSTESARLSLDRPPDDFPPAWSWFVEVTS